MHEASQDASFGNIALLAYRSQGLCTHSLHRKLSKLMFRKTLANCFISAGQYLQEDQSKEAFLHELSKANIKVGNYIKEVRVKLADLIKPD